MIVSTHGKEVFVSKRHGPQGFFLIVFVIWMVSIEVVSIIAIKVNTITIIAFSIIYGIVTSVICAIRVG